MRERNVPARKTGPLFRLTARQTPNVRIYDFTNDALRQPLSPTPPVPMQRTGRHARPATTDAPGSTPPGRAKRSKGQSSGCARQ